ncbi:MAG: polysaccharide biosynthesis/export family protein [Pseudomonadota bacterium]
MRLDGLRLRLWVGLFTVAATVSACGTLPRSGPSKSEIEASTDDLELGVAVVEVNDLVAQRTLIDETLGFSLEFQRAGVRNVDMIGPGDVLTVTIWENVDTPIFGGSLGGSTTNLEFLQVDQDGLIFIPYAGRVRAAGTTPDQLRRTITRLLEDQTPDPQVEVRLNEADSATVDLLGGVTAQGVYPIEASSRTLASMLARAGGTTLEPEIAQIRLRRGNRVGRIWLQDLYDNPSNDIPLRAGDTIIVEEDRRSFIALGALGTQTTLPFPDRRISVLEAIGRSGGLNTQTANPSGVFVFRVEPPAVANALIEGRTEATPQRVAYLIDLTQPGGMFTAADFFIRDGDTVYVTEAPLVQAQKILGAIVPFVNFAGSAASLGPGL